jgi:hypothetical protein
MSVRRRVEQPSSKATFTLDANSLREGIARSMAPRIAMDCQIKKEIKELSVADDRLIYDLNGKYMSMYNGSYPSPKVHKTVNSIQYESNAYMEHNLKMTLTTEGHGDHTTMTFTASARPNPVEDADTHKVETVDTLPVVHEVYTRYDSGCYKKLYQAAYQIEQNWTHQATSAKENSMDFMSGAPYFSAMGVGLQHMLNTASQDFTGTVAMQNNNEISMYNQVRFLITHYASAADAFKSSLHTQALNNRARSYQMAKRMASY